MGKGGVAERLEMYLGMRQMAFGEKVPKEAQNILQGTVEDLLGVAKNSSHAIEKFWAWKSLRQRGHQPTAEEAGRAFVVVCEFTLAGGSVTIPAHNDGNASMYLSSGGGVIGGFAHSNVRSAAMALCTLAETLLATIPISATPALPPVKGEFVVSVLTADGLRTVREIEKNVRSKSHALYPLYVGMHEVIAQLRHMASGKTKHSAQDAATYANCLLTLMAENEFGDITITAGEPLPDLQILARTQDQREWISKERPQNQNSIDSAQIIKLLRKGCSFGLFRRTGTFHAKLVRNNGALADFHFAVERSKDLAGRKTLRFTLKSRITSPPGSSA